MTTHDKIDSTRSARSMGRLASAFYLLTAITFGTGQVLVLSKIVVRGNIVATVNNILTHESLLRVGFAFDIAAIACSIAFTVLLYALFKAVNQTLSLAAAFFHLLGLSMPTFGSFLLLAPFIVLRGSHYSSAFNSLQRQALAYLFLELNPQAWNVVFIIFFGVYCVLIGYLIVQSIFLPWLIGVLMMLAGLGYLTVLYAPLARSLHPYNLVPAAVGELSLMLWLLVFGVNADRWNEQAQRTSVTQLPKPINEANVLDFV